MLYAIAALLVLIADQALKYYVTVKIPLDEGVVTLIPNVMSLVNYHNTGAAFSLLSGGGARWAFVALAVVLTIVVIYLLMHRTIKSPFINWTLVFITAGAIGNAIDRALYGYVVDMFRTDFMNFAIFNVADIFITCGGIALCAAILFTPSEAKSDEQPYDEEDETAPKAKAPRIKLFSEKAQLPEDVAERRRTGKLYGEKKPVDSKDPFAEFEEMPKTFEKPKKPAAPSMEELAENARADAAADRLAAQLQDELSLDAILNEYADGTD